MRGLNIIINGIDMARMNINLSIGKTNMKKNAEIRIPTTIEAIMRPKTKSANLGLSCHKTRSSGCKFTSIFVIYFPLGRI